MAKIEKLREKAQGFAQKGRHDKALELWRDASKKEPFDPELWTGRATAALTAGERPEALDAFFRAADLYARGGYPRDALAATVKVLEVDKSHGGARRLAAMLRSRLGEPDPDDAPVSVPPAASKPELIPVPSLPPEERGRYSSSVELSFTAEPQSELERESSGPVASDIAAAVAQVAEKQGSATAPPRPQPQPQPEPTPQLQSTPQPQPDPSDPGLDAMTLADALPFTELSTPAELESSMPSISGLRSMRELALDEPAPELDIVQVVAASITTSPLLSELDSDLVKRLIDQGDLVHRKKTQTVFKQGQVGTSLFLILRGEVAIVREPAPFTGSSPALSAPVELARLRAGAFFGEMALLTNRPRSATVIAETDVDLLEVSRAHVRELVAREGRILKLLMRFFRARMVSSLLATSPLFKPFAREDRRQLVGRFRLREVPPGRDVIKEGGRSDGLYLVLTGKLQALRIGDEVLGDLGPGDVFGEMSLLTKTPAVASIRTVSKAWVLVLPRDDFAEILSTHPQLLEQLSEVADDRRKRNEEREGVSQRLDPV